MKKIIMRVLLSVAVLIGVLLAVANYGLGYSPKYLYNAPEVATGIGAKLGCSARFASGFSPEQTARDIEVYSSLLALLEYEYDEINRTVTTSLSGFMPRTASYREGIGCALDYRGETARAQVQWPAMASAQAAWPKGNVVFTIDGAIQNKLDAMLEADNQAGHDTRALLVVKDGRVVAESYADGYDAETPLLGWSMTKSVNSLILGQLEREGKISVNETGLYPNWAKDGRAGISVEHLLQMIDGLDFDEEYDPGFAATKMLFQVTDAAEFTAQHKLRAEPGKFFNYSSGTANILADLVQQRIEGGLQADVDYIANQFFRPLGMTSVIYEMDPSGTFVGSSYLYASARDWARIGQLMLNGGELNGRRFVSEDWVQRSVTQNRSDNERAYGYQWWLNAGDASRRWSKLPLSAYAAMGNREQRVMIMPDDNLVIVRLGWSPKPYIDNQNFAEIRSWF